MRIINLSMEFIEYGYIGLFLASFLAATIIPFSSEAILSVIAYNSDHLLLVVIIATFGNWLGGMSSYYLGYLGKWEWIEKYLKIKEQKIISFKKRISRYGGYIAFFSWLPFIGDLLAVALGVLRINLWSVTIFMFAGKFIRYLIVAYFVMEVI